MDIKSVVRGGESFFIVLIVSLASLITIEGQPLDLTTPEGASAAVTAIFSAIFIALRRAWVVSSSTK